MAQKFPKQDFEVLALEARAEFNWAKEEGEARPEGLAFIFDGRIYGGHTRKDIETALGDALRRLDHNFNDASNPNFKLPERILMVTSMIKNDGNPRPALPSQKLLAELKQLAGSSLSVMILGDENTPSREHIIKSAPKIPQN